MVADPGFPEYLPAPSPFPTGDLAHRIVSYERVVSILETEGVRGGAQPNDRLTRVRESLDMPHLLFREITKAREENHQIRFLEHV